ERAERSFRRGLRAARSNVPDEGDGQSIFDDRVRGAVVSPRAWAGAWAAARLVGASFPPRLLAGREVIIEEEERHRSDRLEVLAGLLRVSDPLRLRGDGFRFVAARRERADLLVWIGDETLRTDPVDGAETLDDLEREMPGPPLRLGDLPGELGGPVVERILEEEREALLEETEVLDRRLLSIAGLLGRAGLPAPEWVRRLLPSMLDHRSRTALREIVSSLEDGRAIGTALGELAETRSLADRFHAGIEGIPDADDLSRALLAALRRAREGDAEEWAVRVLGVLDGLNGAGFPLRELGALQDEFFDQRRDGIPCGPKGRALGVWLGFTPGFLGRTADQPRA
ncbi:MAG: DUF3536 domain-containing protein, partial [Candidatus Eisenbacteria bacterium]